MLGTKRSSASDLPFPGTGVLIRRSPGSRNWTIVAFGRVTGPWQQVYTPHFRPGRPSSALRAAHRGVPAHSHPYLELLTLSSRKFHLRGGLMLRMRGMRSRHIIAWLGACLALLTSLSRPPLVFAQADTVSRAALPAGVPVVFGRDTLFFLKAGIGPYTPARRAGMVADRIRRTLRENLATFDSAR